MLCSECNHPLLPITLKSDTGQVNLDYCGSCGGIWSDQGEVNFLKLKNLGPLLMLLPKSPTHPTIKYLLCPKDRSTLEIFKGQSVPLDLSIYYCPTCRGMFFPEGSLREFKKAQAAKLDYFKLWKIPLHSIYAILLPLLLILVLGGGLVATLVGVHQGTDVRTRAKEQISKPLVISLKEDEVLISFTTLKPSTSKIKYWLRPEITTEVWVSIVPKTNHTLDLKNLEENKTYSYTISVVEPEKITSPVYTVTTKIN